MAEQKVTGWKDLTQEDFEKAILNEYFYQMLCNTYTDANLQIASEVLTRYADGKPATVAVINPFKDSKDNIEIYHYKRSKDGSTELSKDAINENEEQLKFFKSLAKIAFAKENPEEIEEWLRNKIIPPEEVLIEDTKGNLSIDTSKCAEQLEKLFNFFTKVTKKSEDEKKVETLYIYYEHVGIWQPDGEQIINRVMESQFRPVISTRVVNEVIDHVKRKKYADLDKITVKSTLVNFKNGVLDLRTLQLLPHDPKYYFMNYIDLNWNPRPKVPEKIIRFLATLAAPNDDNFVSLLETHAYPVLSGYPIKRAVAIVGETNTGKSTFLLLLQKFYGEKFVSHLSMQQMADAAHGQPFPLTSIKGKLLNLSDELPPKYVQDVSVFKQLTGSSTIEGEHKFGGREAFMNQAKLIFSANQMSRPSEDSDAFYSRWQFVELAGDIIEKIKKIDPNARKKAQEEVVEELSIEFEDFLPILVLIAKTKLLPQKDFSAVRTIEENTEMYQKYSHTSEIFLQSMVQEDANAEISKEQLFKAYQTWCGDNGYLVDSQKLFFTTLRSTFPNVQERFFSENTIRKRHIIGIKLKIEGTNATDNGDDKNEEKKFKVDLEQYFDIKLENGESDATAQDAQHVQDFTYLIKIFKTISEIYKEVKEKLVQPDQPVQNSNTILENQPPATASKPMETQPPQNNNATPPQDPSKPTNTPTDPPPHLDAQAQASPQVLSPLPAGPALANSAQAQQQATLLLSRTTQQTRAAEQEAPVTPQQQDARLKEAVQRVYNAVCVAQRKDEPFWQREDLGEPSEDLFPALEGLTTDLIENGLKELEW